MIEIKEEVRVGDIILEKGDKIEVLEEKAKSYYKASVMVIVYEDSYEEGELEEVNSYTLSDITDSSLEGLVDKLEIEIGDQKDWVVNNWNDYDFATEISTSRLVDKNNYPVNKDDIKQWKNGMKTLYSAQYHVLVSKVGEFPVPLEKFKQLKISVEY